MTASGFLVVCSLPEWIGKRSTRYQGINRIPACPSEYPEEAQANDDYVFGRFKDDETNLIPTFERATELLTVRAIAAGV